MTSWDAAWAALCLRCVCSKLVCSKIVRRVGDAWLKDELKKTFKKKIGQVARADVCGQSVELRVAGVPS